MSCTANGRSVAVICIRKVLTYREFKKLCREIVHDFDTLPITDEKKPKVGVVGEILVKFLPAANNYLVDLLESEGAQAVVPDLMDFLLYCFYKPKLQGRAPRKKKSSATVFANFGIAFLESCAVQSGKGTGGK